MLSNPVVAENHLLRFPAGADQRGCVPVPKVHAARATRDLPCVRRSGVQVSAQHRQFPCSYKVGRTWQAIVLLQVPPAMILRKNVDACEFREEVGGFPALRLCQNW